MKESHVREPLYIFLSNMKEMSQFCKSGNCKCLLTKNRLYFQRLFITLRTIQSLLVHKNASHCSRISKKISNDFMAS